MSKDGLLKKQPATPEITTADPIKGWFLGPRCENASFFGERIAEILQVAKGWRTAYTSGDKKLITREDITSNQPVFDGISERVDELLDRLSFDFPFFSPHYIGHMLSETSIPALLGYFTGMLRNSNNVTPEAAAATVKLEQEVGEMLSSMLGLDSRLAWVHLCSGGTIANLESLWAARAVQWLPLCLQEICSSKDTPLETEVVNPNGSVTPLSQTPVQTLLHLGTTRSLQLGVRIRKKICEKYRLSPSEWIALLASCACNPRTQGLAAAQSAATRLAFVEPGAKEKSIAQVPPLQPVIFVSAAAHYSISKAAQVLGYGERSVRNIAVNSQFRIDVRELELQLEQLQPNEYVAAVIGIMGTTEEGAIDPIHELSLAQRHFETTVNKSFWIHVDAAWGGYFATLFHVPIASNKTEWKCPNLSVVLDASLVPKMDTESRTLSWNDEGVLKAFSAVRDADSITIDPHKTGYIPYPAGAVVFRDARVKELLTQRAQYIAAENPDPDAQESFAPYILEGSKPGAAAAACWVAHKSIPLNSEGHGLLMKECVLNAQKLTFYLKEHHRLADMNTAPSIQRRRTLPFGFIPVCQPDTNVVTFLAVPTLVLPNGNAQPVTNKLGKDLAWLNQLNKAVYDELSIAIKKEQDRKVTIPFFISQTDFSPQQYSPESLANLLELVDVSAAEYQNSKLIVLRATVMNPFYRHTEEQGEDLLFKFVKHLHDIVEQKIRIHV